MSAPADKRILNWDGGEPRAHLSVVSTMLSLRASPMCWVPVSPISLLPRL